MNLSMALVDPYGFSLPSSVTPPVWFSEDRKASSPTRAFAPTGEPYTVSLSGTTLTVTFTAAPPANALTQVNANLVF